MNKTQSLNTSLRIIKLEKLDSPFIFVDTVKGSGYVYLNRHADNGKENFWHYEGIFKFKKQDTLINSIEDFYVNDENSYFYEDCMYINGTPIDTTSLKLHDFTLKHNLISDCLTGTYMKADTVFFISKHIIKKKISGFFLICLINNDWLVKNINQWNRFYSEPGRINPMPDFSKYRSMLRPLGKEYYIPSVIFVTDKY